LTRDHTPETAGPERRLSPQEHERFTACVLPWLDAAYNLARYLLRDPHEAEDAVQEAFLRAMRHFDGFRGVEGRAWLLSIVRNVCYTQYRRRRAGGEKLEFDEEVHSFESEASEPEGELERTLAAESVREGLGRLAL